MPSDDQDAGVTAREVIAAEVGRYENSDMPDWAQRPSDSFTGRADDILAALTEAGLCIVNENDLTSMVSELLYQHTNRNQEQAIGDAERAVRRLKDRAAVAPGAEDAR